MAASTRRSRPSAPPAGWGLALPVAFPVALLLRETQGMVGRIQWAFYATGLGLAILASALFFEERGEEARRWARAAREKLRGWDWEGREIPCHSWHDFRA